MALVRGVAFVLRADAATAGRHVNSVLLAVTMTMTVVVVVAAAASVMKVFKTALWPSHYAFRVTLVLTPSYRKAVMAAGEAAPPPLTLRPLCPDVGEAVVPTQPRACSTRTAPAVSAAMPPRSSTSTSTPRVNPRPALTPSPRNRVGVGTQPPNHLNTRVGLHPHVPQPPQTKCQIY